MATLTATAYKAKWTARFADNTIQLIDEAMLREFAGDQADSFGGGQVNVPGYVAGTLYAKNDLILQALVPDGPEYYFLARKAGMLPAPTSRYGDPVNWRPGLPPQPDNATSQSGTWEGVWEAWNAANLVGGRLYVITQRPDGLDIYLEALDRTSFKFDTAYSIDNRTQAAVQQRVNYDLPTDQLTPRQGSADVADELAHHEARTDNPHQVTAPQLGLGSVDNTRDLDKPLSTAALNALAGKAPLNNPSFTGSGVTAPTPPAGSNNTVVATTGWVVAQATALISAAIANLVGNAPAALDTVYELAAQVGNNTSTLSALLSNVASRLSIASNLADLQSASAARANLGLGNVNNTSDANKPVSTAQQAALDGKAAAETYAVLAYASSLALDFGSVATTHVVAAPGDLTITGTSNRAQGKTKRLDITNTNGSAIALAFPAWTTFGAVPSSLATGKVLIVTLECLPATQTSEAGVRAGFAISN